MPFAFETTSQGSLLEHSLYKKYYIDDCQNRKANLELQMLCFMPKKVHPNRSANSTAK
jgi:hypothetical protein